MKRRSGLPPHITLAVDRHGKRRFRFRKAGFSIYIAGEPWSNEFMQQHAAALQGVKERQGNIGASRTLPGTVSALMVAFYRDARFTQLSKYTQRVYLNILERFRIDHGDKRVAGLQREHIKSLIGKLHATPQAANRLLSLLKIMLDLAVDIGWIPANPAIGVKGYPKKTAGHWSWTDDDISTFEAHHPIGSRARLALALLLYTAQRRGDVVRMGWQHVQANRIRVKQQKTGTELEIPLHPSLVDALNAVERGHLTFLTTDLGAPFTPAGFGNWFAEQCKAAGLTARTDRKNCTAHGLRKAAARRLAEAGCTANEIMSITGHRSLAEAARYTAAAGQVHMAERAMKALTGPNGEQNLPNLNSRLDNSSGKLLKNKEK
jgi:integrase